MELPTLTGGVKAPPASQGLHFLSWKGHKSLLRAPSLPVWARGQSHGEAGGPSPAAAPDRLADYLDWQGGGSGGCRWSLHP